MSDNKNELTRKSLSWWDSLEVPPEYVQQDTFHWLAGVAPSPLEHDYIVSTDGSGHVDGYGAYAAVIRHVTDDPDEDVGRRLGAVWTRAGAIYGSTVNRCEMTALLEALQSVLVHAVGEIMTMDGPDEFQVTPIQRMKGGRKVSVLWNTDRGNLARALLYGEDGVPLAGRTSDADLWLRYSYMASRICITPMLGKRNTIYDQALCDEICGKLRTAIKSTIQTSESWQKITPQQVSQKALF